MSLKIFAEYRLRYMVPGGKCMLGRLEIRKFCFTTEDKFSVVQMIVENDFLFDTNTCSH
jgi:hypothetical protein